MGTLCGLVHDVSGEVERKLAEQFTNDAVTAAVTEPNNFTLTVEDLPESEYLCRPRIEELTLQTIQTIRSI